MSKENSGRADEAQQVVGQGENFFGTIEEGFHYGQVVGDDRVRTQDGTYFGLPSERKGLPVGSRVKFRDDMKDVQLIDWERCDHSDSDSSDSLRGWWEVHQYLPHVNVNGFHFILVSDKTLDVPFEFQVKAVAEYIQVCQKQTLAVLVHFEGKKFSEVCFLQATSALNWTADRTFQRAQAPKNLACPGLIVDMTSRAICELVNSVLRDEKILKLFWGSQPYIDQIMVNMVGMLDLQKAFSIDEECLMPLSALSTLTNAKVDPHSCFDQPPASNRPLSLLSPLSPSNLQSGALVLLRVEQIVRTVRPGWSFAKAYLLTQESLKLKVDIGRKADVSHDLNQILSDSCSLQIFLREEVHILKFRNETKDFPSWKTKVEEVTAYKICQDEEAFFWDAATPSEIQQQMQVWEKTKLNDDEKYPEKAEIQVPEKMFCFLDPRNPTLRGPPKQSPGAWWCFHKDLWTGHLATGDGLKQMIQRLVATVRKIRCDKSEDPRNLVAFKDCVIIHGNPVGLPTCNFSRGQIECHFKFDKTKWAFLEVPLEERWPGTREATAATAAARSQPSKNQKTRTSGGRRDRGQTGQTASTSYTFQNDMPRVVNPYIPSAPPFNMVYIPHMQMGFQILPPARLNVEFEGKTSPHDADLPDTPMPTFSWLMGNLREISTVVFSQDICNLRAKFWDPGHKDWFEIAETNMSTVNDAAEKEAEFVGDGAKKYIYYIKLSQSNKTFTQIPLKAPLPPVAESPGVCSTQNFRAQLNVEFEGKTSPHDADLPDTDIPTFSWLMGKLSEISVDFSQGNLRAKFWDPVDGGEWFEIAETNMSAVNNAAEKAKGCDSVPVYRIKLSRKIPLAALPTAAESP